MRIKFWAIVYWLLLMAWITGAWLSMARVNGGFLTNYLADLTFPAWYYIYLRGLSSSNNRLPQLLIFKDWFGVSPERASLSIFTVGIISEVMTLIWPTGIITGTFDYWDIFAYASGLLICYFFDKRTSLIKASWL